MGKAPTAAAAAAATPEMRRKKKGRPSKNPSPISTPPKPSTENSPSRRSTRRNPSNFNSPPQPEFDDDDDDDERKEKKVKLVVRLPQSDDKGKVGEQNRHRRHSRDSDSDSASGSEDREGCAKKRRINGGSDDGELDQDKEVMKMTDIPPKGSPLESGPTTPLPDQKLLVFILDRLQKKDTYGVFSEPVDPNELPDYFEIIDAPMDFGTVRKKLDNGVYKSLEELEADVYLISSNAMQYNASDTVYYRQARAIQDLAKRDFENLKHQGDDGELRPKVVRRGRPPNSKNQKKSVETSPIDRVESVATEVSTGVSLANGEDRTTGSNSYNLRKSPGLFKVRSSDPFVSSCRPRNGISEWSTDWNEEFPASILRADMKHTKRQFTVDETRRDTYKQSLSLANDSTVFPSSFGNMKRLAPVGFQDALAYARSLARYAANLGPIAWKLASKKIEAVLPAGVEYGHGWVGEKQAPLQSFSYSTEKQKPSNIAVGDCNSSKHMASSTCGVSSAVARGPCEGVVEAVRKINSQNELFGQGAAAAPAASMRSQLPAQQNTIHQSYGNGFSTTFGYDLSAAGPARGAAIPGPSMTTNSVTVPSQMMEAVSSTNHTLINRVNPEQGKFPESGNSLPPGYQMAQQREQQRHPVSSVPPDLNVIVPAGSPSSSLQIGSPRQPDLALQL